MRAKFFGMAVVCALIAGCDARVTLDDARKAVSAADETMESAKKLGGQGAAAEALAQAESAQAQLGHARDLYRSARADLSNDPSVVTEFAALCERLRDYDLAGEAFLRAAELHPDDPASAAYWYGAGHNFAAAGGRYVSRAAEPLDRAERLLNAGATGVLKADIEATRGDISWKNGAYDVAMKRYTAALEADPKSLRARMLAASCALAMGDVVTANAMLNELQAQNAPVGENSAFDARLREGYAVFRRARHALPEDAAAYRALASISVRAGFYDEARAAIKHALSLDDKDVFSWNMAGSLAHRAGDVQGAREAFTRSLELNPNQPRTQQSLKQLQAQGDGGAGQGPVR